MASRKIFVVHGHDAAPREAVARFLAQLDFLPIILHEATSGGRTIIEKLEKSGDVSFAVVILTPDDDGAVKGQALQSRARQNVILELGYFVGRLGRHKVFVLKREEVELPSDMLGVVYSAFDNNGAWKHMLAKELQDAGLDIDWSKFSSI